MPDALSTNTLHWRKPAISLHPMIFLIPLFGLSSQLLVVLLLQQGHHPAGTDWKIHMPLAAPVLPTGTNSAPATLQVKLVSDPDGNLVQVKLGDRNLGSGDGAFEALGAEILKLVGVPGAPATSNIEVEIDADYELHYEYVIKAVSHCTGKIDPQTKQLVRYVEKIKFAPPRLPKNG